jgi:hypothetical protein
MGAGQTALGQMLALAPDRQEAVEWGQAARLLPHAPGGPGQALAWRLKPPEGVCHNPRKSGRREAAWPRISGRQYYRLPGQAWGPEQGPGYHEAFDFARKTHRQGGRQEAAVEQVQDCEQQRPAPPMDWLLALAPDTPG